MKSLKPFYGRSISISSSKQGTSRSQYAFGTHSKLFSDKSFIEQDTPNITSSKILNRSEKKRARAFRRNKHLKRKPKGKEEEIQQQTLSNEQLAQYQLHPSSLTWNCPEEWIPYEDTTNSDLLPSHLLIAQDRALNALRLALNIRGSTFQAFVTGITNNRLSTVRQTVQDLLEEEEQSISKLRSKQQQQRSLHDHIVTYNFTRPEQPRHIVLPAGKAKVMQEQMKSLLELCIQDVNNDLLCKQHVTATIGTIRSAIRTDEESSSAFSQNFYDYLKEIEQNLTTHYIANRLSHYNNNNHNSILRKVSCWEIFPEFQMNVLISQDHHHDQQREKGRTVIVEKNPTVQNLFGWIHSSPFGYSSHFTDISLDFMNIRCGSLLRAEGNVLIVDVTDIPTDNVLGSLIRALNHGEIEVQQQHQRILDPKSKWGVEFSAPSVKIQLDTANTRVILVGNHLSDVADWNSKFPEISKIFRVLCDFDYETAVNAQVAIRYAQYVKHVIQEENLPFHFHKSAIAELIKYGVRIIGTRRRVITMMDQYIHPILSEASYICMQESLSNNNNGITLVRDVHIMKAIEQARFRINEPEEKTRKSIREQLTLIHLKGSMVGTVNALSVEDLIPHQASFGTVVKITAAVGMGKTGVINIEREANLSHNIHNKGFLILSGYLRSKYSVEKPLTLDASVCFEQSYGEVDGDSASAAETLAILSGVANLPLRQDIAITGAINQMGEIHPVGSVDEKIEGFFDVCVGEGLTGNQGVIIPNANVADLVLAPRVVEAVQNQQFTIYAVKHVDEALEILTGLKAGQREKIATAKGVQGYEKGTANYYIDKKLVEFADMVDGMPDEDDESSK